MKMTMKTSATTMSCSDIYSFWPSYWTESRYNNNTLIFKYGRDK